MRISNMARAIRLTVALLALTAGASEPATFEFRSGFWVNLNEFLKHQAATSEAPASDDPGWREAVEYYRHEVLPQDELGDAAKAVQWKLSDAEGAERLPTGLDAGIANALGKAAPIYRRTRWAEDDRTNRKWIEAARALVEKYGAGIRKDLAAAWQVSWPSAPIRTDVTAFAGRVGGYTTGDPAHITISSTDPSYREAAALEMLFHEASHTIDAKVSAAIDAELKARGKLFRRRGFSHAILFYTAGETVRRYVPDYVPYGVRNGVLENGWPGSIPVLEKDWKPYLEGKIGLEEAVRAVVEDYSVER
jgi:hypothetical protein